jgi:hypothetical protein
MTSKKAKNCPDFRCETCEDGRIGYVSRLNQNNFLSFFFCHTFMQRSLINFLTYLPVFSLSIKPYPREDYFLNNLVFI